MVQIKEMSFDPTQNVFPRVDIIPFPWIIIALIIGENNRMCSWSYIEWVAKQFSRMEQNRTDSSIAMIIVFPCFWMIKTKHLIYKER